MPRRRIARRLTLALLPLALAPAPAEERAPVPGLDGAACVACQVDLAALRGLHVEDEWRALLAGEVVTQELQGASGRAEVAAAAVAPALPDAVWAVLTDWPAYPRFMPDTVEMRVRRLEARRAFLLRHFRIFGADVRYGVIWQLEPEVGVVRFALDPETENDVASSAGAWRLAPLADVEGTLVRYDVDVDPGRAVPGFVARALTRRSLPGVLRALQQEVARRSAEK